MTSCQRDFILERKVVPNSHLETNPPIFYMQHNLTFSALALIPFSLAAASNPSPICSIIVIGEGSRTAARGAGGGDTRLDWEPFDTYSLQNTLF